MKKQIRLLALFLIASFIPAAAARAQSATGPQVTELDVNGLKVLVKRRTGTPTVAAGLFIRGGSTELTAENAGIESFMLNAATEGGKVFPREKLRKEIARTATSISYSSARDFSVISLVSTKLNFDTAWRMFTDVSMNPAFDPADVERVRAAMLNGLAAKLDSPDSFLQDRVEQTIYAGHPYANDPDGTPANLARFKVSDLAAWHKGVMQTSRLLLVVVGDVDAASIEKLVAASFGTLPRGNYKRASVPAIQFTKPSINVDTRSLETDYVLGSFAAPSPADPDYYPMRVAIYMLNEAVYEAVRVQRNLSYAPSAQMGNMAANTAGIYVTSVRPNEAVAVMLDEIREIRDNPPLAGAIKRSGGSFLTQYYMDQETDAAQAGELARAELIGGGWRNSQQYLDRIRAVTPEQVQAVARKYMTNIRFNVVGDPSHVDRSIFVQNF